jgi:hypothetical protein
MGLRWRRHQQMLRDQVRDANTGAMAPLQDSCPVCAMVRKHESGCRFKGLSMDETWRRWEYERQAQKNSASQNSTSAVNFKKRWLGIRNKSTRLKLGRTAESLLMHR